MILLFWIGHTIAVLSVCVCVSVSVSMHIYVAHVRILGHSE